MKFVLFAVCLCVVGVLSAPEAPRPFIPVLERTEKHDDVGQFALRYLSGDGTSVSQTGALVQADDGRDFVLTHAGEYEFTAPNGQIYRTKYVADKDGFRAEGDHLPKSVVA